MKNLRLLLFIAPILLPSTLSRAQAVTAAAVDVSTLLTLAPGGAATMGIVVGNLPAGQTGEWYIIRAVGPSLGQFGIANPDSKLRLTVFNNQGQPITDEPGIPFAYDWSTMFAAVGAFGLLSGASDAYYVVLLSAGSYSAQVVDTSGKGGAVLIEAYASPPPVIVAE